MPKASPLRSAFNAGELSPLMDGRTDVAKYANGVRELTNFIPAVQGPAVRRPGTRFVREVKTSSQRTWLVRFEFNVDQVFILEFGNNYIRFYTDHGVLLDLDGNPYEIPSPYSTADLITIEGTFAVSTSQTGDVLYCAHPNYPLYRLVRYANDNWAMEIAKLKNGPFKDQNLEKRITVYVSASGTERVTNGTFRQNINSWTLTRFGGGNAPPFPVWEGNPTVSNDGRMKFRSGDPSDSRYAQAQQTITGLTGSTTYYLTFKTYGRLRLWVGSTAGAQDILAIYNTNDADQTSVFTFTTGAGVTTVHLTITNYDTKKNNWAFVDTVAIGSAITLTASEALFSASDVGTQFFMEPSNYANISPWTAGEEFATSPNGQLRRSDGKTYICRTTGSPTSGKRYRTGGDKPIHTSGIQADGGGNGKVGTDIEREGLDWEYLDSNFAIVRIDSFISATQVVCTNLSEWAIPQALTSSTTPTYRWAKYAFGPGEGYPTKVTFFRERLTLAKDQYIYFSQSADFENFAAKNDANEVSAECAISVQLASDEINTINFLAPQQNLIIGTTGHEFSCGENATGEAFNPKNVKVEQATSEGSKDLAPVRVGYSTLFIQRSGRRLKEIAYSFQQNGYITNDMSVLSEHITLGGVSQMVWHRHPYSCVWAVRNDGTMLGFTFNKEQDVVGWHKHELGGSGIVESVCVVPAPEKDRDELWMIVRRTINGVTKRYVEYMEKGFEEGDDKEEAFYVDCGLTYSGAAATTISGLGHLEGQTVQIHANGAAHPDRVVTGGQITLQRSVTKANIGLGYNSNLQTNRIEAGAADGTAQGKTKRINKCAIRFHNTLGAKAGPNASNLDIVDFRYGNDAMDEAPPYFTGDLLVEWPSGYDFDAYIYVRQDQPFPMTIISIMPQVHTFDR